MAILSREEYFDRLSKHIGDNNTDEAIAFMEDMTDTYNSLTDKITQNGDDWEKKYHDLDNTWKERYKHRFFSGGSNAYSEEKESSTEETNERIKIEDLFDERKD